MRNNIGITITAYGSNSNFLVVEDLTLVYPQPFEVITNLKRGTSTVDGVSDVIFRLRIWLLYSHDNFLNEGNLR